MADDAGPEPSPVAAAGQKAYIDPATGRILPRPPAGAPSSAAQQPDLNNSSEGLVEQASPKPGGGYMLDLKGRFRSTVYATKGPDGKPQVRHVPVTPPAADSK